MNFIQLASQLADLPPGQDYPLEHWQPPHCGVLPLLIDRNGQWWSTHNSQPSAYRRASLVKLLSKLLWCSTDHTAKPYKPGDPKPCYSLKTPTESVEIQVEDVPFTLVDYQWQEQQGQTCLLGYNNLGDSVIIGEQHPLYTHPEAPFIPYVHIRHNLWARFNRNVYYRLINELLVQQTDHSEQLWLQSQGCRFNIAGGMDNDKTNHSP